MTVNNTQSPVAAKPDLSEPVPAAPDGMTHMTRTRFQIDWDDYAVATTDETWHPTLGEAVNRGLHSACVRACQWVTVYAADGTLECTWRRTDESGAYDNQWRNVGPAAIAAHAARTAEIVEQMRAEHRRNGARRAQPSR